MFTAVLIARRGDHHELKTGSSSLAHGSGGWGVRACSDQGTEESRGRDPAAEIPHSVRNDRVGGRHDVSGSVGMMRNGDTLVLGPARPRSPRGTRFGRSWDCIETLVAHGTDGIGHAFT